MNFEPLLLSLGKNTKGQDFIVGDIHGCYEALIDQLGSLGFNKEIDRLICTGDLINRGPSSSDVIDLLSEPWFFSTLGNHEYLFLKGIRDKSSYHRMLFLKHGGEWIARTKSKDWDRWFNLVGKLPLAIDLINKHDKKIGAIHADFISNDWNKLQRLSPKEHMSCIWSRERLKNKTAERVKNIDWVIHGHSIVAKETRINNHIFIDSGAYKGKDFIILHADEL